MKTAASKKDPIKVAAKSKNKPVVSSEVKALKAQKEELEQRLQEISALHDQMKAAQEELVGSSERNNQVLEQAVDSVVAINTEKLITFYNSSAEKMFGYTREEVIGQNVKMIVPMEHREGHDQYVDSNINTGVNKVVGKGRDLEMVRKNGEKFWGNLSLSKVKVEGGYQYTAFIKDITEQKTYLASQERLQRELETRMDQINVACLVSESDLKGNITFVNEKLLEVTQYTREECMGQPHNMFRHPDSPKEVFKEMWATIGRGNIFRGVIKNRKKDGNPYWVDAIIAPVMGTNGKPMKYIGVRYDITEQILKEEELKVSKAESEQIQMAVDTSFAAIEFTLDGIILKANTNFLQAMGFSDSNEIVGKHHRIFCKPEYANSAAYASFWVDLASGRINSGEFERVTKDGKLVWLNASYTPVRDSSGKIVKVIKIARDISSIKLPVLQVSDIISKMAQGDLTQKFDITAEGYVQQMGDALNVALENLNALLGSIGESANFVADSSISMLEKSESIKNNTTEVASAISQMAKGAQDQALKTDESSKLVEEVMNTANEMESKADVIYKTAEQGQNSCENGIKIIKKLVENMEGISSSAGITSESINVLTQRAEEIARTLNVITDIASQTNLLALNAAIEAARAGDAGRGFAVVAEEIRKLAEDSRRSAVDIEKIIGDVQKDTQSASKAIEKMESSVKDGNIATREADTIFQEIAKSSQQTLSYSKEIQNATSGQKASIDLVVKNIEQIVVVAEETAAGTEEVASSSQALNASMNEVTQASNKLSQIAAELQAGVGQFKMRSGKK
ncbi:methyl-accepting chemotaxis protein [Catalinimonas niigatensis]|uniref:methyl-accepting chemotaxis protein n=1 Tax=Catalinimonas niigatensis TaxID=1397264 RepID=UPI002665AA95|nr:PAS domain S-box protein [Catalinimonas niigatensis]WPP53122.1 PAS domain S-box protein [Catalinimonas niigatensis]